MFVTFVLYFSILRVTKGVQMKLRHVLKNLNKMIYELERELELAVDGVHVASQIRDGKMLDTAVAEVASLSAQIKSLKRFKKLLTKKAG